MGCLTLCTNLSRSQAILRISASPLLGNWKSLYSTRLNSDRNRSPILNKNQVTDVCLSCSLLRLDKYKQIEAGLEAMKRELQLKLDNVSLD